MGSEGRAGEVDLRGRAFSRSVGLSPRGGVKSVKLAHILQYENTVYCNTSLLYVNLIVSFNKYILQIL